MNEEQELRKYFREMGDLFRQPGWKHIIEQMGDLEKSWSDLGRLNSVEQLFTAKGALIVIDTILALEDVTKETAEDYPDGS